MKNAKIAILMLLVFSALLIGCTSSQPSYAAYSQGAPQGQGGQYVGGGCGVAPSGNYEDTNTGAFSQPDSGL